MPVLARSTHTCVASQRDDAGRSWCIACHPAPWGQGRAVHDRQRGKSGVSFPIVSVFRMVAAGCVVHFERKGTASWSPRTVVASTCWLPARYAEQNDKKPDVDCTVDGEPTPAVDRDERPAPVRSRRALDQPSDKVVADFALVHAPFRDWCWHCIACKAPDWPRRRVVRDDDEVKMVQVHSYVMNKKGGSDIPTLLSCVVCK